MEEIGNRITQFCEEYNANIVTPTAKRLSLSAIERACGFSNSYLRRKNTITASDLAILTSHFPELNSDYLLTGQGHPLRTAQPTNTANITTGNISGGTNNIGHGNLTIVEPTSTYTTSDPTIPDALPIIPRRIYDIADIDVFDYCMRNASELAESPRIRQLPNYDLCYPVIDDEMAPHINAGDKLYLRAFPISASPNIVPGRTYVIDTRTNGLLTRQLFHRSDHFLAHPINPSYPDHPIPYADIIRIYRIVGRLSTYF